MCERVPCQHEMVITLHCLIAPLKMLCVTKYDYWAVLEAP